MTSEHKEFPSEPEVFQQEYTLTRFQCWLNPPEILMLHSVLVMMLAGCIAMLKIMAPILPWPLTALFCAFVLWLFARILWRFLTVIPWRFRFRPYKKVVLVYDGARIGAEHEKMFFLVEGSEAIVRKGVLNVSIIASREGGSPILVPTSAASRETLMTWLG